MGIPEKWMQQYNKGTAPQNPVTDADVQELLALFDSTYLQLCEDLKKGKFSLSFKLNNCPCYKTKNNSKECPKSPECALDA